MNLTPNDIIQKEFDTKFRGYDIDQVNDYLDVIVAEIERLHAVNNSLKQELAAAMDKNEYFAQLQESLNSSIIIAQEAADRLKDNARKEAELILYEAEREAEASVKSANEHAQNIITETEALRRHSKNYRERLETMIREQLEVVSSEKYHELFDEKLAISDRTSEVSSAQRANERLEALTEEVNQPTPPEPLLDEPVHVDVPASSEVELDEDVISETIRIELPTEDE